MAGVEELRARLRAFLAFARPKTLHLQTDGARTVQLRRIADIRLNQFAVRKPNMNAVDVNGLLAGDPAKRKFAALALEERLFRPEDAALPLVKQSEELGYFVECCILADVLTMDQMRGLVREFGAANPLAAAAPPPPAPETPPAPSEVELPEKIAKLLGNVQDLWSIPATTQKLIGALSNPNTKIESVVGDIERDPGLSAQMLRVVNSAFYAVATKVSSIRRAVVMLGYQTAKRIVTVASLVSKLGKEHSDVQFDLKSFWGHSLWVAYAAQTVAQISKLGVPDEHFSAGLLHDIGKLVEYQYLRHAMREILSGVAGGGRYEEVETRVLGVNHAVIGACVCAKWDFPPAVVEAVRHHLDPLDSLEDQELPRTAMVVPVLCALSKSTPSPEEMERFGRILKLTPGQIAEAQGEATRTSLGSLKDVFAYA
ncbi:MAG: HDOD domain-containing protein [Planctomycetes bacterium]|nr:HDOD domain-containing protein [Planctomycetota bacterium]